MKISVFINTLNEAKRIKSCLESIKWADEIVIVDMHSEDATLDIARQYTDKIFLFDRMGYCEPARKFAASKTTGDWILNLDADEMVTAGLKKELLRIAHEGTYNAVYVPRKNYFWGVEMQFSGCGQFQDRQLRFYQRNAVTFNDIIHAGIQLSPEAKPFRIDDPQAHFLHFSYNTLSQYWEKTQRYTSIEAKTLFDTNKSYTFKNALRDAWNAFYKRYIKKSKGYKDGEWGFMYCVWTAVYKLNVYAQYLLMKTYQTPEYEPSIETKYQAIITDALKELQEEPHARRD